MASPPLSDELAQQAADLMRDNGMNLSASARLAGVARQTFQTRVKIAHERGFIGDEGLRDPNTPTSEQYLEAKTRKIAAFQAKKRKGDWRKPVMIRLPSRPFRLKVFGDPHLDDDGCDFDLFERHWMEMDAGNGVYGVCIGDFFDNWLRALSHLWKDHTTPPSDAWLCLEYLMEARGAALIAACSGNHDDWTHGPADPVDLLMKKYGVVYRRGAVRPMLAFDGLDPIFIGMRHKWRGHSMYSAAHGILRAGIFGWRDLLMIGGHIHQDEPRLLIHPDGFKSHVCQVSAFKLYDDFKDVQGFMGPQISPVWDLVIDPRRSDSDPDKVKIFWTSADAAAHLDHLRAL